MRVNLSDRSCTTLGAVGLRRAQSSWRKTWRTQEAICSFRLLRAGFEPSRACANPSSYLDCAKPMAARGVTQSHRGATRTARLKTGARQFRRLGRTMGAPSFSPYRSGVGHAIDLTGSGSRRTSTGGGPTGFRSPTASANSLLSPPLKGELKRRSRSVIPNRPEPSPVIFNNGTADR
jgi:hypothetical protein